MNTEKWFKEKLEGFRSDVDFHAEELILDLTEQVVAIMKKLDINRTELAQRLGVSKAFITKLLNGNPNLTLRTMASLAMSLGCNVNIDICPKDVEIFKVYRPSRSQKHIDPKQFTEEFKIPEQELIYEYESAA